LKVVFTVQENALLISGASYLLWAIENYPAFNKIADEYAAKEAEEAQQEEEEEVPEDDSAKMDEIIKCIRALEGRVNGVSTQLEDLSGDQRAMKGEIDHITSKVETLEMNQETAHTENMSTHQRLDDITVKVKEIRQLTGVSAKIQSERDLRNAEKKMNQEDQQGQGGRASPTKGLDRKKSKGPPGSPKKTSVGSPVKKRSTGKQQKNRLEEDSGYKESSNYERENDVIRRLEEEDDDKIEEMIDDISTNEMFGSSILSNGDGDN